MFGILEQTIEWKLWGWNLATLTFLFTVLFTLIDGWGYKKQSETIWEKESAESVSVIVFFYSASVCYSYTIYSVFIGSVAVLFNGLVLGYNIFFLVWGILKFKNLTVTEKILCTLFSPMILAMLFLPWKDGMFFIFMMGGMFSLVTQPLEMWRNKSAGAVDIRAMTVFTLGVFFWSAYGFAIEKLAIAIPSMIALVLYGLITLLWFKYQKEPLTFEKFLLLFCQRKN